MVFYRHFPFLVAKELIFRLNDINVPEEMLGRVKRFFFWKKLGLLEVLSQSSSRVKANFH